MSLYIIESLHKDLTIVLRETETSNRIRSLLVPKKIFAEDMNDEDLPPHQLLLLPGGSDSGAVNKNLFIN